MRDQPKAAGPLPADLGKVAGALEKKARRAHQWHHFGLDIEVRLCWRDRLRVLLGSPLRARVHLESWNDPGRNEGKVRVSLIRWNGGDIRLQHGSEVAVRKNAAPIEEIPMVPSPIAPRA